MRGNRCAAFLAAQGGSVATSQFFEHSLALFRQVGDHAGIAETLYNLGMLARYPGNRTKSAAFLQESRTMAQAAGNRLIEAHGLHQLGLLFWEHGDLVEAEQHVIAAQAMYQELGARINENRARLILGDILLRRDALTAARDTFAQVLVRARELGDRGSEARTLHALGVVTMRMGALTQAQTYYEASLAVFRAAGHIPDTAVVRRDQGYLTLNAGDLETARAYFLECQQLGLTHLGIEVVAHSLTALAAIDARQDRPERAARQLGAAQALRERFGLRPHGRDDALVRQTASTLSARLGAAAFTHYTATAVAVVHGQLPHITFKSGWEAIQELNIAQVVANAIDAAF